jgi:hypothetical protein
MQNLITRGLPSAGLFAGPAAWLVSTQANYALASWTCAHGLRAVPILAVPLIGLSLTGGFLSWRAFGRRPDDGERTVPAPDGPQTTSLDSPKGGRPHRMIAAISTLIALLFALAIAVHGAAGLVFDGCER